jgi:hypothetical protein
MLGPPELPGLMAALVTKRSVVYSDPDTKLVISPPVMLGSIMPMG